MIIVEGPDGAGKTTLINQLVEVTGLPVAPRVVSKDAEAMVDLKKWTEDNVAKGWQSIIYDRHRLISEPIYGSVLRNKFEPGFDDPTWLYLMNHQLYQVVNPIIIYCLPPFETVLDNTKDDPDNAVVAGHKIRKIYAQYVAKFASDMALNPQNTFKYDYTDTTYKGPLFKVILNQMERSQLNATPF